MTAAANPADVFAPKPVGAALCPHVVERLRRLVAGGETSAINIHDARHLLDVVTRGPR